MDKSFMRKCDNCNSKIRRGAKYCSTCGVKIKPITKETDEYFKDDDGTEFPINLTLLCRLISLNDSSSLTEWLLFLFSTPILAMIVWYRSRKIRQWLNLDSHENSGLHYFKKQISSIRRCGILAILIGLAFTIGGITQMNNFPEARLYTPYFVMYVIIGLIGMFNGVRMIKLSTAILSDLGSDKL